MARIYGWVEEVTACDCCGKSGLKGTFACDVDGEVQHYGSTCVTRNTGIKNATKAAADWKAERTAAARVELHAHPAHIALQARFKERDALNMEPGRGAADFVREASLAQRAAASEIAARFNISQLHA